MTKLTGINDSCVKDLLNSHSTLKTLSAAYNPVYDLKIAKVDR